MTSTRFFGFVPVVAGVIQILHRLFRKSASVSNSKHCSRLDCHAISGMSLERFWDLVVIAERYRWSENTPKRSINQIDKFLDYVEFKMSCFVEGDPESYSFFQEHFIAVTYVTDRSTAVPTLNIKVEVVKRETLEVIKVFKMSNLK